MNFREIARQTVRLTTLAAVWGWASLSVQAQGLTFPIERFNVQGNTLLPATELSALLQPFTGTGRGFGDVQLAQEALENAYRSRGYAAVAVTLPEQDISSGVVEIRVIEAQLDRVRVTGNQHVGEANVRRGLPSIASGQLPNTRVMAQEVGLVNENPAKRVEVLLQVSDQPGKVNAEIRVQDEPAQRWMMSLDNTGRGTPQGDLRLSVLWQHANLFDRDHVLTAQYTTSPEQPRDVTQINVGYKVPYYRLGHSIEVFAGYSNVDAGALGAGIDGFTGKGKVLGLKYNQRLARQGEIEHTVRYGLDWRQFENACTGLACPLLGSDVTAAPWSVTYQGQQTGMAQQTGWAVAYVRNTGWGSLNSAANYAQATHRPGTSGADQGYSVLRLNASHLRQFATGTQVRVNVAAQFTADALIAAEQLGLAGAQQVRGYTEREVSRDQGYVVNLELYSPELNTKVGAGTEDSVRLLAFVDHASGRYTRKPGDMDSGRQVLSSVGAGVRWSYAKRVNLRLDIAQALNTTGTTRRSDWAGHLSVSASF